MTKDQYARDLLARATAAAAQGDQWATVFAFYAALHAVDHAVPSRRFGSHRERDAAVRTERSLSSIQQQYFTLKAASVSVRYEPGDPPYGSTTVTNHLRFATFILKRCGIS